MIRWTDGLYGGLIAGVVSALFFLFAGIAVIHEPVLGRYFVDFAIAVFGSRIEGAPIVALLFGLFLHFAAAALFGIFYAIMAARFKPAWAAPTSVLCGITYGFFMFFIAEDVMVPLLRVVSYTPQRGLPRDRGLGVHHHRAPSQPSGRCLTLSAGRANLSVDLALPSAGC